MTVQRPPPSTVPSPATQGRPRKGEATTIKAPLTLATVVAAIAATGATSFAAGTLRGAAAVGTGRGFQWGDAGVGAAAATGALLVLIGSSLILLRRKMRASGPALKRAAPRPLNAAQSTHPDVETERSNDEHDGDQ